MTGLRLILIGCAVLLCLSTTAPSARAQSAQECSEIVLGAALSLTGEHANAGRDAKRGFESAVQAINAKGGIEVGTRCFTLRVSYFDAESNRDRAASLAERLIEQGNIRHLLGPYNHDLAESVALVAGQRKVPIVMPGNLPVQAFARDNGYLFAVATPASQTFTQAIDLAAGLGDRVQPHSGRLRVAIAGQRDPITTDAMAGAREHVRKIGARLVLYQHLPEQSAQLAVITTKLRQSKPDLVLIANRRTSLDEIAGQLDDLGALQIAADHCLDIGTAGPAARLAVGALCTAQWSEMLGYRGDVFGTSAAFAKAFRSAHAAFGDRPVPDRIAQAAVSVLVFADAFARSESLDGETVRDALRATDLATFYGPIRFNHDGHNIAKPMVVNQLDATGLRLVAPKGHGPGPFQPF